MLAEFAEWLNKQPKEKRAQIINQFVYVYNTEPSKGEIALLKRTLAKKEQEIGELKSYCDELKYKASHPSLQQLYVQSCHEPVIEEAKKRITAAFLYKSLCDINAALRKDKSFYHKETIRLGLEMAKLQQQIYSKE